jgi:ketosteroid isomerase-like protein
VQEVLVSEHANVTLTRDTYAAIAKGDLDSIRELLADNVVFHIPGRGPLGGERNGKDAVLQFVAQLNERTGGGLKVEPYAVLANDEYAAALVRVRGERDGKGLEDTGVHVFRIVNGKIAERWSYPGDLYKTDDFFA